MITVLGLLGVAQQLVEVVGEDLEDQALVISKHEVVQQLHEMLLISRVFLVDFA